MSEQISGYARLLARTRVERELTKPLFGKPYLKYGQCLGIWGYFFQLGGLLGAKHKAALDAFKPAFLGARGEIGAIENFFLAVAQRLRTDFSVGSLNFNDYVLQEQAQRISYAGNPLDMFLEWGKKRFPPDTAIDLAWQYAQQGSAIGAIHPEIIRAMYALTHAPVPEEEWNRARGYGLDIPATQDRMTYQDVEEAEDAMFMEYCRQCCPNLHLLLVE